jgi:YD repeat-containing protein
VTDVIGPNGATATTTYDTYGRPSQSKIPDGAQANYAYSYYPSANTQTATITSGDLANPIWKRTTVDGFGRVIQVSSGHDSITVSAVDTQYAPCGCSPLGKVRQVSMPYAPNPDGSLPSPDPRVWTTYAYDERGRTVSVTAPDGSVTQYSYYLNQTTTWDASLKWKTQSMDSLGNLTNVLEPLGNSTTYTYDGLNHITAVNMQTPSGPQTRTLLTTGRIR